MLFTSYLFWGFFALLLLLYYMIPAKLQWPLLLVAGILFYLSFGAQAFPYILITAVTVYVTAWLVGKSIKKQAEYLKMHGLELDREKKAAYKKKQKKRRFLAVVFCAVLNLGILGVVKYTDVSAVVPLGISYYTLSAIGYLADVYKETAEAEKNPGKLLLFLSFFPLVIQGPISRYSQLEKTLYKPHRFSRKNVDLGLERMMWGYFKKLVIADRIYAGVHTILSDTQSYQGAYIVVLMLFYTLELYADFTGGIDIAIGIGQTLGITVTENFNRPYISGSLKEYWRRWHISMCDWFRSYVFYPVSASRFMQKLSRFCRRKLGECFGKKIPVFLSSFVVWILTGIWHGAGWNFLVWGLLNWFILMISEVLTPVYDRFHRCSSFSGTRVYHAFTVARTFLLVCVLNLFDCFTGVGDIFRLLKSVFVQGNWSILFDGSLLVIGLTGWDYGVLFWGVVLLVFVGKRQDKGDVREQINAKPFWLRSMVWGVLLLCVCCGQAFL